MAKKNEPILDDEELDDTQDETTTEPEEKDPWEPVAIRVKRSDTSDQDLFVGFNGKNYILPKGKVSMVPRCVADEIIRSRQAQEVADEHIDELLAKTEEAQKYLR